MAEAIVSVNVVPGAVARAAETKVALDTKVETTDASPSPG